MAVNPKTGLPDIGEGPEPVLRTPMTGPLPGTTIEVPEDAPDAVEDAAHTSWLGGVADWERRMMARSRGGPTPKYWDPLYYVPLGYEEYADAFAMAANQTEINEIKRQIDYGFQLRRRQARRGIATTLAAELPIGVADPTNLLPFGLAIKGAGAGVNAVRGGVAATGIALGTETARINLDPLAQPEEMLISLPASAVLGGGITAAVGHGEAPVIGARSPGARPPGPPPGRGLPPVAAPLAPAPGAGTARAPVPPPVPPAGRPVPLTQTLTPPLAGKPTISSGFGARRAPQTRQGRGSRFHEGVDYRVPEGTPVYAQADGEVVMAERHGGFGNYVRIKYGDGRVMGGYGHLKGYAVKAGDRVRRGDIIGYSGSTGKSTGPHLHHQIFIDGKLVDPLSPAARAEGHVEPTVAPGRGADLGIEPPPTVDLPDLERSIPVTQGEAPDGSAAGWTPAKSIAEIGERVANDARAATTPIDGGEPAEPMSVLQPQFSRDAPDDAAPGPDAVAEPLPEPPAVPPEPVVPPPVAPPRIGVDLPAAAPPQGVAEGLEPAAAAPESEPGVTPRAAERGPQFEEVAEPAAPTAPLLPDPFEVPATPKEIAAEPPLVPETPAVRRRKAEEELTPAELAAKGAAARELADQIEAKLTGGGYAPGTRFEAVHPYSGSVLQRGKDGRPVWLKPEEFALLLHGEADRLGVPRQGVLDLQPPAGPPAPTAAAEAPTVREVRYGSQQPADPAPEGMVWKPVYAEGAKFLKKDGTPVARPPKPLGWELVDELAPPPAQRATLGPAANALTDMSLAETREMVSRLLRAADEIEREARRTGIEEVTVRNPDGTTFRQKAKDRAAELRDRAWELTDNLSASERDWVGQDVDGDPLGREAPGPTPPPVRDDAGEELSQQTRQARTDAEPPPRAGVDPEEAAAREEGIVEDTLGADEKTLAAGFYGHKVWNSSTVQALLADAKKAARDGIDSIDVGIRWLVAKVHVGLMAVALALSPTMIGKTDIGVTTAVHAAEVAGAELRPVPATAAKSMSADAQLVYGRVADVAAKKGTGFIIVDKPDGMIHLFDKNGQLIASGPALTGASLGDRLDPANLQGVFSKEQIRAIPEGQRITPAGLLTTARSKSGDFLWLNNAAGENYQIAIHNTEDASRLPRLVTASDADNRVSFGCVNVDPELFARTFGAGIDRFANNVVFVMPNDPALTDQLLAAQGRTEGGAREENGRSQWDAVAGDARASSPVAGSPVDPELAAAGPLGVLALGAGRRRQRRRPGSAPTPQPKPPAYDLPWGSEEGPQGDASWHGENLRLDMNRIRQDYANQVWTQPGAATPLPADAFASEAEYAQFVANREGYRSAAPPLAKEGPTAYEDRLAGLALAAVKANGTNFVPSANKLQYALLRPTPIGQLQALIGDHPDARIFETMMRLAGDHAMFTARAREGGAVVPGGSVLQRREMWMRELLPVRTAMQKGWESIRDELRTAGGPRRAYTRQEFDDDVIRVVMGVPKVEELGEVHSLPYIPNQAREAAMAFTDMTDKVRAAALKTGTFMQIPQKIARTKQRIANLTAREQRYRGQNSTAGDMIADDILVSIKEQETRLADLEDQQQNMPPDAFKPKFGNGYFTRNWDQGVIEAHKREFLDELEEAYRREGHPNPDLSAKSTYDEIMTDPGAGQRHTGGGPKYSKHREVPLTDEEAFKWLVRKPEAVASVYLRRMGSEIEMTRRFGDAWGEEEFARLKEDMTQRGIPEDKQRKAMQLIFDARDKVVGNFHGKSPLSWDNRTARALKNYGNLMMGGVIKSQLSDTARIIATQGLGLNKYLGKDGPAGLIQGIHALLAGDHRRFGDTPAAVVGEAYELVSSKLNAELIEHDSALFTTRQNWLEKGLARLQHPFFIANLMNPVTVAQKNVAGVLAVHNLIEDARSVASATRAGTAVDPKARARLAKGGINDLDALLLADMPTEVSPHGLILANIDAWDGMGEKGARAADVFRAAVNGEIKRAVPTPGPLDRPAIFDGVLHTGRGRNKGYEKLEAARVAVDDHRKDMSLNKLWQLSEDDPLRVAGINKLRELMGEATQAYRDLGHAGRMEAPLLSLPFQMHSFVMAAAGKVAHGLLTAPERNKLGGLAAMAGFGLITWYFKNYDMVNSGKATIQQAVAGAIDESGVTSWLGDLTKNVDAGFNLQLLDKLGLGNEFDPEGEKVTDETGAFTGVALGSLARIVEGGFRDDDKEVMKALPFRNLIWVDMATRLLSQFFGDGERSPLEDQNDQTPFTGGEPLRGRHGIAVDDLRHLNNGPVDGGEALEAADPAEMIDWRAREIARRRAIRTGDTVH